MPLLRGLNTISDTLITLLVVSFMLFMVMGLMPGDPVDLMLAANPNATAEDAARLKAIYGLDQPLLARYGDWLLSFLQGDLGFSRLYSMRVADILFPALMKTLALIGASLVMGLCIAMPLGVMAALRAGQKTDTMIRAIAFTGQSIPPFWVALMLILIFSVTLQWLPSGGSDGVLHYILPVLSLSLAFVSSYIRHIRSAVLEVLGQQHILTAKAKGVGRLHVLLRHILPCAMTPIVTLLALDLGVIMSGAVITETVFNMRGMGRLIYDAIIGNDYHLALTALMVVTICIILANRLADALYPLLDPRQREG